MAEDILGILNSTYKSVSSNFNQTEQTMRSGINGIINNERLTNDGYLNMSGNWSEENKKYREHQNEILKSYKEQLSAMKNINQEYKNLNQNIKNLAAENYVFQAKQEEDLAKNKLNKYKQLYNYINDKDRELYKQLDEEEANIYQTAIENKRSLTDEEIKQLEDIEKRRLQSEENVHKEKLKKLNVFKNATHSVIKELANFANEMTDMFFFNQAKKGMSDFVQVYEQNFTELAGRFGTGRSETTNLLGTGLSTVNNDTVLSKALNYSSDVMPAILSAAQQGFLGEEAIEIGITNALDKKLMPWLNTSSETWSYMQFSMSEEALNSIKGQQLLLQATREGNRLLQTGIISTLTDQFAPLLSSIEINTTSKEDLGQFYAIAQAQLGDNAPESLIKETAKSMYNAIYKPMDALNSNKNVDKLRAIGYMRTGSATGMEDYLYNSVGKHMEAMGDNRIALGAWFNMLGIDAYAHTQSAVKQAFTPISESSQYPGLGSIDDLENIYNNAANNAVDKVTATQAYDNQIQNNWAEKILERLETPHASDIQVKIWDEVINIKRWLITSIGVTFLSGKLNKLIDKLGGNLSGYSFADKIELGKMAAEEGKFGLGLQTGGIVGGLTQGGTALSGGLASGIGATAVGTAGLLGGALLVGKGVSTGIDTVKNWDKSSTTDKTVGVLSSAGMVGGGAALGAAALGLASGPVGWIGLAVGGIALAGKAIYDYNKKMSEACTNVDILGSSFTTLKDQVKQNTDAKLKELDSIRSSFYSLGDETKQRQLLINKGIIPNTDKTKLSTEMLEKYIEKMDIITSDSGEKQEEVLGGLEAKYTASSKNEIKSMIDQIYGQLKGKDEKTQRKLLSELGFSDEEIDAGMKNRMNGAMSDGELWEFLAVNDTKMKGVEIGSLQEKLESGEINENTLNRYASKHKITDDRITSKEKWMSGLGELVEAVDYLDRYKEFGRAENPKEAKGADAVGFNQDTYNQYKNYILSLGKGNKQKVTDVFTEYGISSDVLSDYPNSLKGYKLGSSYIPNDMLAMLHTGERVLTEGQNKKYTEELVSGNSSSSIIQAGVQDIVVAIKTQTSEIINYLSTIKIGGSTFGNSHLNMLPSMGNTKVTL